jgi:competence protein ComEA
MAELSSPPSREEHDFWDAQFRDPARPRRAPRSDATEGLTLPRRDRRHARASEPVFRRLAERVGDRLGDWRHDARFGVVVLIGVALVAGVIWYRIGIGGANAGEAGAAPAAVSTTAPSTTIVDPTPTTRGGGAGAAGSKDAPATIVVHVAGAVNHPGVVELHSGARVIDAVEAVGGAQADGDLDRLNLAAKVSDGQRVYVVKVGQADPGALGDSSEPSGTDDAGTGATGGKVNLNTASQAQLEDLPGIGPTYAEAIIAERQRRGGFTSVNDLRSVHGIGDKRFAELAPLVSV